MDNFQASHTKLHPTCWKYLDVTFKSGACRNQNFGKLVTRHAGCRIEWNSTVSPKNGCKDGDNVSKEPPLRQIQWCSCRTSNCLWTDGFRSLWNGNLLERSTKRMMPSPKHVHTPWQFAVVSQWTEVYRWWTSGKFVIIRCVVNWQSKVTQNNMVVVGQKNVAEMRISPDNVTSIEVGETLDNLYGPSQSSGNWNIGVRNHIRIQVAILK